MTFDDIVDLKVNSGFEVFISDKGDLATVKGREAFEQKVIIRLTDRMDGLISRLEKETISELAKSYARRVANNTDRLESMPTFETTFPDDKPNTLEIRIVYDSGEDLTFEVNG